MPKGDNNKGQKWGASADEGDLLQRSYGSLPVVDATANMVIYVKAEHIEQAVKGDPERCAFAQSCSASIGSQKVVFFRSRAYVDLPTEDGSRAIFRFLLPPRTRKLIEDFDRDLPVEAGAYLLSAPYGSQLLDAQLTRQRRLRSAKKTGEQREATIRGKVVGGRGHALTQEGVRVGTGMAHFTRQSD